MPVRVASPSVHLTEAADEGGATKPLSRASPAGVARSLGATCHPLQGYNGTIPIPLNFTSTTPC